MNKPDLLSMAAHNLLRHKGRTILTILGVMIGVTAIIVMISLALGLTASMTSTMEQWGSLNEVEVYRGYSTNEALYQKIADTLTMLATGGDRR